MVQSSDMKFQGKSNKYFSEIKVIFIYLFICLFIKRTIIKPKAYRITSVSCQNR